MRTNRKVAGPGTVASDDLVDVATADLDRAEQGIARGALKELDAMDAQRNSGEKSRSAGRQSSEHSQAPSGRSANIPSIRNGVARILNAAAEAVEEYLDVEEDEDKVPEIPEIDRFEGMREKVQGFIAQVEGSTPQTGNRISLDSSESLSQRNQSLRSRGQSLGSRNRSIPGVEASSTEHFNEKVPTLGSSNLSPFSRVQVNHPLSVKQGPSSPTEERRLLRSDQVAFDRRSNTSFEIMGRDKVRDSMLAGSQARESLGLPPLSRNRAHSSRVPPLSGSTNSNRNPRLSDAQPSRAFSYVPIDDPTHRYSLGSQPSRGLGTIEEIRHGDAGQLVRRRIALPWQTTLLFGCITCFGCLCAMTTLGIAIRNVVYLNGPKAGPQIPDVIRSLEQILKLLGDPQLDLGNG